MDVVGQQVGLGAHHQGVPGAAGSQHARRQTADALVDVEEGHVRVLAALRQPVGRSPLGAHVRVVDEDLPERETQNQKQDRRGASLTFPACVAAVRHGWRPSKVPTVTMRGLILWFSFSVNIGTNMAARKRLCCQTKVKV